MTITSWLKIVGTARVTSARRMGVRSNSSVRSFVFAMGSLLC